MFNTVSDKVARRRAQAIPVVHKAKPIRHVILDLKGRESVFLAVTYLGLKSKGWQPGAAAAHARYVVYDALTIAVRNAAKHGPHPGSLAIGTAIEDVGAAKTLEITVISELRQGDDAESALTRVKQAGEAGARGADVVEGLSGIRKLKKMETERSILSFAMSAVVDDPHRLRTAFTVPFRGLLE
jgi:hypothetical protein